MRVSDVSGRGKWDATGDELKNQKIQKTVEQ
jgi:hypothetical protein